MHDLYITVHVMAVLILLVLFMGLGVIIGSNTTKVK